MTDLELAQNANTDSQVLIKLASSRFRLICEAVARNPNTPEMVLQRLAVLYPKAFLENPVLDFLRFENPAWFADLPTYAQHALLASSACPQAWLENPRLDHDARLAALKNPKLPLTIMTSWLEFAEPRVLDAMGHYCRFSDQLGLALGLTLPELDRNSELLKDVVVSGLPLEPRFLEVLATDYDSELRGYIAARADTPQSVLEALALDEETSVATAARANLKSDFATRAEALALTASRDLLRLARGGVRARRLAAQHVGISANLLAKLSRDEDWRVRQAVAQHHKTSARVLQRLAKDADRDVREAVANNPKAAVNTVQLLLSDVYEPVQKAARKHPHAPQDLLRLLIRLEEKDPTFFELENLPSWLDEWVVAHPNATVAMLEAFAKHPSETIRSLVATHFRTPQKVLESLLEDADFSVVVSLASRANLSDVMAQKLTTHVEVRVLEAVAANPNLSKAMLEKLAQSTSWEVRRVVAQHPRCPIILLEEFSLDVDADVREAAFRHPKANSVVALHALGVELRLPQALQQIENQDSGLTADWLEFAARRGNTALRQLVASHPNLSWDVMEWFLAQEWKIRLALAKNPMLPAAFLKRLATDDDRDVRAAIAAHDNTPLYLLQQLSKDPDAIVRVAVAQRGQCFETLIWDEDETVLALIAKDHPYWLLRQKLEISAALEPAELALLLQIESVFVWQKLPRTTFLPNLEALLQHDLWQVRIAAVQNLYCSAAQLEQMLTDPDRDVRAAVARHANCPAEVLRVLMQDTDILVRRVALAQANLEPALRQLAQRLILDENLRSSTLNRMIALPLTTRVSELRKRRNYASLEWRERLAVVQNPLTPHDILEVLSTDANRLVQVAAKTKLEAQP